MTYLTAKLGGIIPQHDDMENFDNGFALEGAFGYRANKNLALEFGLGRVSVNASESGYISGLGTVTVNADAAAVAVLGAEVKFIRGKVEFFDEKSNFDSVMLWALLSFSL